MEENKTIDFSEFEHIFNQIVANTFIKREHKEGVTIAYSVNEPEGLTKEQKELYNQHRKRLEKLAEETQKNPPREFNDHVKLLCDQGNIFFDMLIIKAPELNTEERRRLFVNGLAKNVINAIIEKDTAEKKEHGEKTQAGDLATPGTDTAPAEQLILTPELIAAIKAPLNFDISTDKVAIDLDNLFLLLSDDRKLLPGQLNFAEYKGFADTTKNTKDSKKLPATQKALVYYGLDFTEAMKDGKVSRGLTAYDLRINTAIDALFVAGNKIITAQAIYNAAGWEGQCNKRDRGKILESVRKMAKAWLTLSNKIEHDKYNNMVEFEYEGNFLQAEIVTAKVNGIVTNDAIMIKDRPAVMRFSAMRNHIYTFDIKLLRPPINKTDKNLRIENYLQTQIALMKKGVRNNPKILFESLYNACNLKMKWRTDRPRYEETIKKLLEYYKKIDFIKNFKMTEEGIIITP